MKNVHEITITVEGQDWTKAIDKAFNKKKNEVKIPGFRKGTVTKEIYIKKMGIESLFIDASDIAIEDAYVKALKDSKLEPVCEPSVSIEKIDKEEITYKFTIITKPEIKLGKYTKLGVKKEKVEVSKEEINEEVEKLRNNMAEVINKENGEIVNGNIAVIDFEGFVDGKPLDGGKGTDYSLEIGSNSFIPGFEEGLLGLKVGETKELNLKFPKDYVEHLKGKDVKFNVTIKEIKERSIPELDKDFFEDLGIKDVTDKKSLEEHIKHEIEEKKNDEVENKYIDELLHKATDNMKVELNEEIIHGEIHRMVHQYQDELRYQGASLEQYFKMTGTTMEDLENMMKPQAEARLKTRYLLESIVEEEKIKVDKKEVKEEIKKNAEKYGMKEEEFLDAVGGEDAIEYDLKMHKALDIIKEA
ncbi:MAG: trigger factor [Bacilli bacterium]|nr:trigger factor [Bacilli bacterium]